MLWERQLAQAVAGPIGPTGGAIAPLQTNQAPQKGCARPRVYLSLNTHQAPNSTSEFCQFSCADERYLIPAITRKCQFDMYSILK